MGRPRKTEGGPATIERKKDAMEKALTEADKEPVAIEDMPLETLRDYRLYNEAARAENKRLRRCQYPIKPCPVELHPTERVKFGRVDQPTNPLPVYVSDDKIDYKKTLIPGKVYDLPLYIIHYLQEKGYPIYDYVDKPDGTRETVMVSKKPRFTLQTVYTG